MQKTFDKEPCIGSSINDLNIYLFKMAYLPKSVSAEALANDKRNIKLQLASFHFYDLAHDCPTNAGILMFGNNVRYFFSTAYVQYIKFEGTTVASKVLANTLFSGDLISIVNKLNNFVKINVMKKRPLSVSTLTEANMFNYSDFAVREFLMNSLMHRSYEINSFIKFYQYSDRIEIISPGGLFGNARPENFPNVSDYRNLVIAESMRVMGYVNCFNSGIEMAQLDLKNNENEPAEFDLNTLGVFGVIIKEKPIEKISADFFNIKKYGEVNNEYDTENKDDGSLINKIGSENKGDGIVMNSINKHVNIDILSKSEKIIFHLIKDNKTVNIKKISELSQISYRTVARYLKSLKDKELIEYVGSAKKGGYRITAAK